MTSDDSMLTSRSHLTKRKYETVAPPKWPVYTENARWRNPTKRRQKKRTTNDDNDEDDIYEYGECHDDYDNATICYDDDDMRNSLD